jgi:hypothetical protein
VIEKADGSHELDFFPVCSTHMGSFVSCNLTKAKTEEDQDERYMAMQGEMIDFGVGLSLYFKFLKYMAGTLGARDLYRYCGSSSVVLFSH